MTIHFSSRWTRASIATIDSSARRRLTFVHSHSSVRTQSKMQMAAVGSLLTSRLPAFSAIIGLTGGIGSGKSQARQYLNSLGAVAVDADSLGHKAYAPNGPAYDAVIAEFSASILSDGYGSNIDRARLGALIFGTDEASQSRRSKLNSIVWPAVLQLTVEELAAQAQRRLAGSAGPGTAEEGHSQPRPTCLVGVVEAALLLEAGWADMMDGVWVMRVPAEEAVSRVMARNNLSLEAASARVASQMPNEDRVRHPGVTAVIDSSGPVEATRRQLKRHWDDLLMDVSRRS